MPDDALPNRRSIRWKEFDYTQGAGYFITVCTHQRKPIFGETQNGKVCLTRIGHIAQECWLEIPCHFAAVQLDVFVAMPNHLHGVFAVLKWARHAVPLQIPPRSQFGKPASDSVGTIVGAYKAAVTKRAREETGNRFLQVWQRNYYDHVIRGGKDYNTIAKYIAENPARWEFDRENPLRVATEIDPWE